MHKKKFVMKRKVYKIIRSEKDGGANDSIVSCRYNHLARYYITHSVLVIVLPLFLKDGSLSKKVQGKM